MINPRRAKLALLFSHPMWLVAVAAIGWVLAVGYAIQAKFTGHQLRMSLIIGIGVGLPMFYLTKRLIRANVESYADFSLGIALNTRSWKAHRTSILAAIPMLLAFGITALIAHLLHMRYVPILGMLMMLSLIAYPEQEDVHNRMKSMVDG
jgi:hypothetical protein